MAKMNKEAQIAISKFIVKAKQKLAEIDDIDNEFAELDATIPEGMGTDKFDLLSEKREELEEEIKEMREHAQLITAWEAFKGGDWSEEVKAELNSLDEQFASIADGVDDAMDFGNPPTGHIAPDSPEALPEPEAPIEPLPEVTEPAEPLTPPMASKSSKSSKKMNYELQDKKGSLTPVSSQKGDNNHMANQSKPSLQEKLAEVKAKRETLKKEAQNRVASAWTIAKTILPTAPLEVKKAFASSLLSNSTKVLNAALRQTAINSHYTKVAETIKEVHKIELNDLMEDPSVLKGERSSVEKELRGEAKNATDKKADDRKDAGPIEGTYDDGRKGSEPKEIDASKAAERPDAGKKPGQTQNLSEGKTEKAAKKAACTGTECKGCDGCKDKTASKSKKAEEGDVPPAPAPVEEVNEAPLEEAPAELPAPVEADPEAEAGDILAEEKKMVLEEKVDEVLDAVKSLEAEIREEGNEEPPFSELEGEEEGFEEGFEEGLEEEAEEGFEGFEGEGEEEGLDEGEIDLSKVFDEDGMEDKVSSFANEGEKVSAEEEEFFSPTSASRLEASMDDKYANDMSDIFSLQGSDGDPLATLMASLKTAEQVAGIELVDSFSEAADHFEHKEVSPETRDHESDHEGDIWREAIENLAPEEQGSKRVTQDTTNELELPKAAKTKPVLKKIKANAGSSDRTPRINIGDALFNDGFGND